MGRGDRLEGWVGVCVRLWCAVERCGGMCCRDGSCLSICNAALVSDLFPWSAVEEIGWAGNAFRIRGESW